MKDSEVPRPMKFWEVLSAFRSREDIVAAVFQSQEWREPFLAHFENRQQLMARQDRETLDMLVPWELSRAIAAQFEGRFVYDPDSGILRSIEGRRFASAHAVELTALEVHDRFGGSVIEEVFEKGSVYVPASTE